jgi:hypothetical protein
LIREIIIWLTVQERISVMLSAPLAVMVPALITLADSAAMAF